MLVKHLLCLRRDAVIWYAFFSFNPGNIFVRQKLFHPFIGEESLVSLWLNSSEKWLTASKWQSQYRYKTCSQNCLPLRVYQIYISVRIVEGTHFWAMHVINARHCLETVFIVRFRTCKSLQTWAPCPGVCAAHVTLSSDLLVRWHGISHTCNS